MRRSDIDGLRAIAIAAVIAFHAFPFTLPGGFVGVDVFFVISGYLITGIISSRIDHGTFTIQEFYIARARRILPALAIVLLACLSFGSVALFPDELKDLGAQVLAAAGFATNLLLWRKAGYFDEAAALKPLLHLWSLGIEEQFYLVWPLLLLIGAQLRLRPFAIALCVGAASFLLNVTWIDGHPISTFYSPVTRIWELLIGALLVRAEGLKAKRTLKEAASIGGICLVLISAISFSASSHFPGWRAVLPTVGAGLLLFAGPSASINRILSTPPFVALGLISYPLYLWHWPLLSFYAIVNGHPPTLLAAGLLMALACTLAWATYRIVEIPFRAAVDRSRRWVAFPVVATLIMGFAGTIAWFSNGLPQRPMAIQAQLASQQIGGSLWAYSQNPACSNSWQKGWSLFCIQNRAGDPNIMIIGNSYANHLYPGVVAAMNDRVVLNIGTCDPARIGSDVSECDLQDRIIENDGALQLVVVGSDWTHAISFPGYASALTNRLYPIVSRGIPVVLVGPKLELAFHVRNCLDRPFKLTSTSCAFPRLDIEAKAAPIVRALTQVAKSSPLISLLDPLPLFCNQTTCTPNKNGVPLLRDAGHLSEYGSVQVMKALPQKVGLEVTRTSIPSPKLPE
jgi:peptidoglycan/LPS O-acetylase OafA/YrhL